MYYHYNLATYSQRIIWSKELRGCFRWNHRVLQLPELRAKLMFSGMTKFHLVLSYPCHRLSIRIITRLTGFLVIVFGRIDLTCLGKSFSFQSGYLTSQCRSPIHIFVFLMLLLSLVIPNGTKLRVFLFIKFFFNKTPIGPQMGGKTLDIFFSPLQCF